MLWIFRLYFLFFLFPADASDKRAHSSTSFIKKKKKKKLLKMFSLDRWMNSCLPLSTTIKRTYRRCVRRPLFRTWKIRNSIQSSSERNRRQQLVFAPGSSISWSSTKFSVRWALSLLEYRIDSNATHAYERTKFQYKSVFFLFFGCPWPFTVCCNFYSPWVKSWIRKSSFNDLFVRSFVKFFLLSTITNHRY